MQEYAGWNPAESGTIGIIPESTRQYEVTWILCAGGSDRVERHASWPSDARANPDLENTAAILGDDERFEVTVGIGDDDCWTSVQVACSARLGLP
eukprot:SAG11_NODE_4897_length_1731_cov_1.602941_2_plen_95_part_00